MRFDCCVGYSWGNNRLHFCLAPIPWALQPSAQTAFSLLGSLVQLSGGISTWSDCMRKGEPAGSGWSQGQTSQVTSKPQGKVKLKKKNTKTEVFWHTSAVLRWEKSGLCVEVGWEVKRQSTNFLPVLKKCFIK